MAFVADCDDYVVFKVVHSKLLSETWEPRLLTHDGNNQPVLLAYAV
jgi:hypothetical protein